MPDNEDWLFRPWLAGLVDYRDLVYGTDFTLSDIARMNLALEVQDENTRRIQEWLKNHPD